MSYKTAFWILVFILAWAYKEDIISRFDAYIEEQPDDLKDLVTASVTVEKVNALVKHETTIEDSKRFIEELNKIRQKHGKKSISFDGRVYNLAMARAKDMAENHYLDHTNPETGECPYTMKAKYGIMTYEDVAENGIGASGASFSYNYALNDWLESRGHRYNLLYDNHISGAYASYGGYGTFLGLNHDEFGKGCSTAKQGIQFWQTVEMQDGEVVL